MLKFGTREVQSAKRKAQSGKRGGAGGGQPWRVNKGMKMKPNRSIRNLRKTIGRTQSEFAAMIGASKDTVVSWETGRNKLSAAFARRITFATGAREDSLLRGSGNVIFDLLLEPPKVYEAEDFERYRQTGWGRSDAESAWEHLGHCDDALELLFLAATKAGGGKLRYRLPAVVDCFVQWCDRTRKDFKLGPAIDEELRKRKFTKDATMSYRQWRSILRNNPAALKAVGFRQDRGKGDEELLTLYVEFAPGWAPGRSMQAPDPLIKVALLPQGRTRRVREARSGKKLKC